MGWRPKLLNNELSRAKSNSHLWMVKAPHCSELAWKFPFSTCKYLVLTVCDRSLLNNATFVPEATHTTTEPKQISTERCGSNSIVMQKLGYHSAQKTWKSIQRYYRPNSTLQQPIKSHNWDIVLLRVVSTFLIIIGGWREQQWTVSGSKAELLSWC